ncbi:Extended synaptotagmin-2-B [Fasciola gigantica]|uniref:Extended synaptotagmin-2-B n=1 Tax=Fasciola gigantica TaxID=46835 RepID=A0A504YUT1_FASGI|nr:Extended synaptotagmin-2-B [Fasciola gigantica]
MSEVIGAEEPRKRQSFLSLSWAYLKFFGSCLSLWSVGYFQFSPTWIALGSFGYFVIQIARNRRVGLTSSLKAIGENEKNFILRNFSVRDLPSWVYFPDVDRAEWLNKAIKRMWPYISDYARDIILQNVEPAISANLPAALKPFKFSVIDLGDTPPRIGGVKVYMEESIQRDEVVMDLDLMLYSDARIKVSCGKIKAGIKEFELRGTLRVVMKPLIPKVPFTGAVTVCFLDSPYIQFSLTDMGNVLGLPGLQQTLNNVIRDVINQLIVLPNRLPIQLVDDVNCQRLKYPMPQGVLRMHVMAARNLKVGDKPVVGRGSSDPYCVVRVGARTFKTAVINTTLEPVWNEYYETIVDVHGGQNLEVEVYDKDQGNKDDPLGNTTIPLDSVYDRGEIDTWAPLENVKTGSIHLKLSWFNFSDQTTDVTEAINQALAYRKASGRAMSAGFLYVVIEQANNLRRVKQMQEPSAYCNVILGREAQMTVVKHRTQSPMWDSVHHFLVGDPFVDVLQIVVCDSRTGSNLGSCQIPVKLLLTENNMSVSRPFPLKEAGPEGATIYLHLELKALIPKPAEIPITGAVLNSTGSAEHEPPPSPGFKIPPPSAAKLQSELPPDMDVRRREQHMTPDEEEQPVVFPTKPNKDDELVITPDLAPTIRSTGLPVTSNNHDSIARPLLGRIRLTTHYRETERMLQVLVHEADHLVGVDNDGLADPYVKVFLVDEHGAARGDKKKTKVHKDNLNPVFEECFNFMIDVAEMSSLGLRVDVKNHVALFTRSGKVHNMGSVYMELYKLVGSGPVTNWYPLSSIGRHCFW